MNKNQRLKECRQGNHIKVKDLAKMLNVSPRTIYYWEDGRSECDYETLTKLSELYQETVDYLLARDSKF